MKPAVDAASQPPTITLIFSEDALGGTSAIMVVLFTTVNELAGVLPNFTPVAPVKPEPAMVTIVYAGPLAGIKELIVATGAQFAVVVTEMVLELGETSVFPNEFQL